MRVVVPVAHLELLGVVRHERAAHPGPLRGGQLRIVRRCREGEREAAGRGGGAGEDIDEGTAVLLGSVCVCVGGGEWEGQ